MNLPIPTHLLPYLVPTGKNSETRVRGSIRCICGHDSFAVSESNDRLLVHLSCAACAKDILLFDADSHGWDGFVCGDAYLDRTLPLKAHTCRRCGRSVFSVEVAISSQGKQDFMEECMENDMTDKFTEDDWVNAFEWITVGLTCTGCRKTEIDWLDAETM